jgi:phenylalanyl-tRNA synthetase beta chain
MSFAAATDPEAGSFPALRLRLSNPMSRDQEAMRTSLLPGLARTLARNVAWGNHEGRIFELGRVFWPHPGQELPDEARSLALAVQLRHGAEVRAPLLELKGALATVVKFLSGEEPGFEQAEVTGLHPGRGATVWLHGRQIGCVGQLRPELVARLDGGGPQLVAELNFDAVVEKPHVPRFQALPRYPAVYRDLALAVAESTPVHDVIVVMRELGEGILRSVEVFDEYRGSQLAEGRKGVTLRLSYQRDDRTLTGDEVNAAQAGIIAGLAQRFGAEER